ncbi:MAG: N-acetylglucosaminyldiphosphoundecaprenol N-acetyl-beta-D-mannosaminyltransferase [Acidobacteriaceae bacterium]|jgi:N-acetylglucosaminyldiphosphoundecaprenol N-acetyl-beta-D-mannosaminyltransferase|nr:N-acetylglucosaminyldiphosphoundecaprenol N-acetyl-beta-D-mannosaminyltransferase [Acidobacteriaceae bacterium]
MNVNTHWFAASASARTLLRGPNVDRVGVGHALIDNCSSEQVCASIIAHAQNGGKPAYVITPNAQHIVLLEKDRRLQEIYDHADLVIPDGISLLIAARLYGRSLQQRVAGVDVFKVLCGQAAEANLHVFLLGGRPGSAELAATVLKSAYPNLRCSTYCPIFGFEQSPGALKETADAIASAHPDILFVAFGAPKQEYWIYEHGLQLSVPVCIGVGGSFEIVGGVVPRAPMWAQNIGCEWLYRLCREPRRMWRRYIFGNLEFAAIVLRQRIRRSVLDAFVHFVNENRFAAELSELTLLQHNKFLDNRSSVTTRDVEGLSTPTI